MLNRKTEKILTNCIIEYKWFASVGVAAIVFLIAINTSITVASALSSIPCVDRLIKVLTIKEYYIWRSG